MPISNGLSNYSAYDIALHDYLRRELPRAEFMIQVDNSYRRVLVQGRYRDRNAVINIDQEQIDLLRGSFSGLHKFFIYITEDFRRLLNYEPESRVPPPIQEMLNGPLLFPDRWATNYEYYDETLSRPILPSDKAIPLPPKPKFPGKYDLEACEGEHIPASARNIDL